MSLLTDKIELEIQEAELETQKALAGFPLLWRWLIILLVIGIVPAYFIAKGVSHGIWLNRYQQGAIKAKPSFTNPRPPKFSPFSITTLGPLQYAAIIQITNQNLDLSLEKVPYTVIFTNQAGQTIYSYPDVLFLLPNQTKYLTVPTFTSTEAVTNAEISLPQNLPWQKRLQIPQVNLNTSLPGSFYQNDPPAFVVSGDFTNSSPYNLAKVRLTFILHDTSGNIVGISQRSESTVAAFERRAYKQLWPNATVPNLGRVEVLADTDTLDPNNLSTPDAGTNPSSDLSRPSSGRQ